MSGRKIDDHSFWAGKGGKDHVLPKGVHVKHMSDSEHAGAMNHYEDTEEAIHKTQNASASKVKSHSPKENYRH